MRVTKFIRALLLVLYWQIPIGIKTERHVVQDSLSRELSKKKRREKKRQPKVVPEFKWQQQKRKLQGKYLSTQPKDVRFSDQRKLRRMFRNC